MGRFYGGGTVFPGGAAPATVPVIRQSAFAPPQAMPIGAVVPSAPAGFAPYMVRPEFVGAPVQRGVVPGLFDQQSAASFVRGGAAAPVNLFPNVPGGAAPIGPPSPVLPMFTTAASNAIQRAVTTDYRAASSAKLSIEAQRTADAAAHQATVAATKATMDPSPSTQGDAQAKAQAAAQAQAQADAAAQQAAEHDYLAAKAADHAQGVADRAAQAQADHAAANADAVAQADQKAADPNAWYTGGGADGTPYGYPDQYGPPGPAQGGPPVPPTPMGSHGLLVTGGGAVAGFVLGGPIGALVGAALGAGLNFLQNR